MTSQRIRLTLVVDAEASPKIWSEAKQESNSVLVFCHRPYIPRKIVNRYLGF